MLQKMLKQEEKMHEILEGIHQGHVAAVPIPNFLPLKVTSMSSIQLCFHHITC